MASAYTDDGENAQAETAGAALASDTVREAVFVPVPDEASVATMVNDFAPVDVPVATVIPESTQVLPVVLVKV